MPTTLKRIVAVVCAGVFLSACAQQEEDIGSFLTSDVALLAAAAAVVAVVAAGDGDSMYEE